MFSGATFLPLTLTVLDRLCADHPAVRVTPAAPGARAVADAVLGVERDASTVWQSLLGDARAAARADLVFGLRRMSWVVGRFVGLDWWNSAGSGHRDRVARYQLWLEEAVADDDGAGFARAFAGYDEAVARAVTAARGGSGHGVAERVGARRSGTMAGWARQARAMTSRVALHATQRRGTWTTSRRATSSSRWSRRSRSAG